MFALADCNNFYASCERVFRPELVGKPVIVLSGNDGCAVARSNEAKALGIAMGAPFFKIKDIVERNNVAVFSGNFALYGDMSRRVQEVLRRYSPSVEQYSIDEAFLDLRGIKADFDAYAKEISARCYRETSIPVSVGIAPTKTLAKIASKLCKKYPALRGGCFMYRPEDVEKVLRKFPVEDVWGIGRRSVPRLAQMGVKTAYDFTRLPGEAVRNLFALPGWRTWRELQGHPCIEFEDYARSKQSICVSRSFAKDITSPELLSEQVANFARSAVEKLRHQGSVCLEMAVFAITNRFHENEPQAFCSQLLSFPDGTADYRTIMAASAEAALHMHRPGLAFKKAGVVITKLAAASSVIPSLFEDASVAQKNGRLSAALDSLTAAYGPGAVRLGSQGDGRIKSTLEHQSPHYTTLWTDIPSVTVK